MDADLAFDALADPVRREILAVLTGRFRYYSVDPTGPAQDVIRFLQELFRGSLDAVKAAAEKPADASDARAM